MVRSPVVGMISTLMWSFNSASQAYLQVLDFSVCPYIVSFMMLQRVRQNRHECLRPLSLQIEGYKRFHQSRRHQILFLPCFGAQFFPQLVGKTFREAAFYFPDAILLGLVNQNRRAAAESSIFDLVINDWSSFSQEPAKQDSALSSVVDCISKGYCAYDMSNAHGLAWRVRQV